MAGNNALDLLGTNDSMNQYNDHILRLNESGELDWAPRQKLSCGKRVKVWTGQNKGATICLNPIIKAISEATEEYLQARPAGDDFDGQKTYLARLENVQRHVQHLNLKAKNHNNKKFFQFILLIIRIFKKFARKAERMDGTNLQKAITEVAEAIQAEEVRRAEAQRKREKEKLGDDADSTDSDNDPLFDALEADMLSSASESGERDEPSPAGSTPTSSPQKPEEQAVTPKSVSDQGDLVMQLGDLASVVVEKERELVEEEAEEESDQEFPLASLIDSSDDEGVDEVDGELEQATTLSPPGSPLAQSSPPPERANEEKVDYTPYLFGGLIESSDEEDADLRAADLATGPLPADPLFSEEGKALLPLLSGFITPEKTAKGGCVQSGTPMSPAHQDALVNPVGKKPLEDTPVGDSFTVELTDEEAEAFSDPLEADMLSSASESGERDKPSPTGSTPLLSPQKPGEQAVTPKSVSDQEFSLAVLFDSFDDEDVDKVDDEGVDKVDDEGVDKVDDEGLIESSGEEDADPREADLATGPLLANPRKALGGFITPEKTAKGGGAQFGTPMSPAHQDALVNLVGKKRLEDTPIGDSFTVELTDEEAEAFKDVTTLQSQNEDDKDDELGHAAASSLAAAPAAAPTGKESYILAAVKIGVGAFQLWHDPYSFFSGSNTQPTVVSTKKTAQVLDFDQVVPE